MSQPLELSPDVAAAYDSAGLKNKTPGGAATSNAYKSYISDFNPQSEIHVSWQDTIAEASVEDEEHKSSQSSLQISQAFIADKISSSIAHADYPTT